MKTGLVTTAGAVVLGFTAMAWAQAPSPTNREQGAAMSDTSAKGFLTHAAQGGMAEVELGRLAESKAQSADVKAFAQQMVTDHSKAGDEIKALAVKKNIVLPTAIEPKHKAERDKLAALSGPAFDKAYVEAMLTDHEKDVSEFKHQSTMNQDPDVKTWATKTLPTLEAHLNRVKNLRKSVSGTE